MKSLCCVGPCHWRFAPGIFERDKLGEWSLETECESGLIIEAFPYDDRWRRLHESELGGLPAALNGPFVEERGECVNRQREPGLPKRRGVGVSSKRKCGGCRDYRNGEGRKDRQRGRVRRVVGIRRGAPDAEAGHAENKRLVWQTRAPARASCRWSLPRAFGVNVPSKVSLSPSREKETALTWLDY